MNLDKVVLKNLKNLLELLGLTDGSLKTTTSPRQSSSIRNLWVKKSVVVRLPSHQKTCLPKWLQHINNTLQSIRSYMGISKNGGTQQPWVFLLKMMILGCFGCTTIFGNPHICV